MSKGKNRTSQERKTGVQRERTEPVERTKSVNEKGRGNQERKEQSPEGTQGGRGSRKKKQKWYARRGGKGT